MTVDMTDLERARAHLLCRQEMLAIARCNSFLGFVRQNEDAFLAALEWVWAEQQKAGPIMPGTVYRAGWQHMLEPPREVEDAE